MKKKVKYNLMKSDNGFNSRDFIGMNDKQRICQLSVLWFPCRGVWPVLRFSGPSSFNVGPTQRQPRADLLIINWLPVQCLPSLGFHFSNRLRLAGYRTSPFSVYLNCKVSIDLVSRWFSLTWIWFLGSWESEIKLLFFRVTLIHV